MLALGHKNCFLSGHTDRQHHLPEQAYYVSVAIRLHKHVMRPKNSATAALVNSTCSILLACTAAPPPPRHDHGLVQH